MPAFFGFEVISVPFVSVKTAVFLAKCVATGGLVPNELTWDKLLCIEMPFELADCVLSQFLSHPR